MIVATCRARNGALIQIDDGCAAVRGSIFETQIIDEQRRIAHSILVAYTDREREIDHEAYSCISDGRECG